MRRREVVEGASEKKVGRDIAEAVSRRETYCSDYDDACALRPGMPSALEEPRADRAYVRVPKLQRDSKLPVD